MTTAAEKFLDEINKSQQLLSSLTRMKTEYLRKLSTAIGVMVADHPSGFNAAAHTHRSGQDFVESIVIRTK